MSKHLHELIASLDAIDLRYHSNPLTIIFLFGAKHKFLGYGSRSKPGFGSVLSSIGPFPSHFLSILWLSSF